MQQQSRNNIEAIYSLSPMQEGMLFHRLYNPASEAHFGQSSFTLHGKLDVAAFKRAWEYVVDTHPVLRTLFLWQRHEKPLQVVRRKVVLPFVEIDWRNISQAQQDELFETFLRDDRERGFDLSQAPLMRFAVIRSTDTTYRFVWSHHHIIVDGWSLPLILDQVFVAYRASVRGESAPPIEARPYRDYIAWLQKQDLDKAKAYWQETLKGFTSPTQIGAAGPGRETNSAGEHYDAHRTWLSESTTATLQSLARQHHLTLNTVIQGAWSLLLSHYSGEEDVVFGTTVSGRPAELEGIETMVGLFINTLPVRVKLRGGERLLAWLKKLQEQQVEMRHYDFSPLVQVQEWSEVPRRQPLFESIFVFESYPVAKVLKDTNSELRITEVVHRERSHYPLTMIVGAGQRTLLKLAYDASKFESDAIQRMVTHFQVLLENIAANPAQRIADYSLLTEQEKHQSILEWNQTTTSYPIDRCVHQLFEEQVERTPDAAAVRYGEQQISYSELNRRANQLAHFLRQQGVGPEVRVGIMLEPSLEMIVGLVGILKAGGAYVPLDLAYPQQRLQFMIKDADVHLVVTQQKHLETLGLEQRAAVCIDSDRETIAKQSEQNLSAGTTTDNLVYIIYTSGSTGIPKGVAVTHRAVNRLVFNTNYVSWSTSDDRFAQASNSSFDALTFEVWGALLHGALLVGVSKEIALSPQRLIRHIEEQQINVMFLTTALFNQIIWFDPRAFRSLRYLMVGGEAADPKSMQEALAKGMPEHFQHVYGPTESTTFALYHPLTEIPEGAHTVPIGGPISNTQAYILNRYLHPVPVGIAGDLYLGGDGLARGYWDGPQLTAEKFVPHPYSDRPGERLYYTGDVTLYCSGGAIEFVGRRDEQIKLRGFRVELGEIEAALASYAGIREQVVIVREDQPSDRRLTAYFVTDPGYQPSPLALRQYLQEKLPPYMVPAAFVQLPALPLNANGKIDRRALPSPEQSASDLDSYIAPRNAFEEEVIRIWSEVLMVEPIGAHDNFFDLGGHSLLAIQLISKLRQNFKVDIPLRTLFEEPTPAQISVALQTALRNDDFMVVAPPITPAPRNQSLPLSFAQQRLWFLDQLQPNSPAYNVPLAFRLNGKLNSTAFQRSLDQIVARHESLRTCFPMERGKPVQLIKESAEAILETTDITHLNSSERAAQSQALIREEAERPFDLAVGPLFRTRIITLGEDEHVLLLTMHHIVADGWSLGVLMKELGELYETELAGAESRRRLPELTIQYADYAVWQRERMNGGELERELAFWSEELKDSPRVLELNVARGPRRGQNNRGATERLSLSQELTRQIKETSRREGVTLFMFLLTAFYVLLHYYSKREDIVVGVDVANRNHGGTEDIVGLFVNQVVMRADLSGQPGFQDLLARVSAMTLRVYAHQDLPFDKLVDSLKLERRLGRNPLFQVMFGLQNLPRWSKEMPGLTLTPLRAETETTIFDLSLYMAETDRKLIGWMRYSTDLFTSEIVNRMIEHYQTILEKVVAEPAITLQALHDSLAESDQQLQTSKQTESRETLHRMLTTMRPQPVKGVVIPVIQ